MAPVVKKSVDNVKEKKHGEDLMTVIGYGIMLCGVAPDDMEEEARLEALVEKKYKDRYGSDATPGKQQVCINGRTRIVNHYAKKDHDLIDEAIGEGY